MERLIFHVDVNSAFLSWEAASRVKAGEPDLREIPSAVGGDPNPFLPRNTEYRLVSPWQWPFENARIW